MQSKSKGALEGRQRHNRRMTSTLNPYLSFRDNAREAMEFYKSVFGGQLDISTFGEMHASEDPAEQDLVMHSMLKTDSGFTLMGSDTPKSMDLTDGSNITVSLSGDDSELGTYFEKLVDGGTVTAPLMKADWGDTFGMGVDKYGVAWMVNIAGTPR
jgi:PhnB protein